MQLPLPQDGIERVDSIIGLDVVNNNRQTATDHMSYILTDCPSLLMHFVGFVVMIYLSFHEGCVPGYSIRQNHILLAGMACYRATLC